MPATATTSLANRDLEEWADTDFDIPDGQPMIQTDAESGDEDWDAAIASPSKPRKSKPDPALPTPSSIITGTVTRLGTAVSVKATETWDDVGMPAEHVSLTPKIVEDSKWDGDEDEGASTIKLSQKPIIPPKIPPPTLLEEDIEDDFALPSDLSHLSLRPLHHRPSKSSIDAWGDHTSSTTYSSEASSLGTYASPSSNSTSNYSQPETETDDDEDGMLDGLVLPEGLFDNGKGSKELVRMLELKKQIPIPDDRIKVASPDDGEDFEIGLVLDEQVDFSPSRLRHHVPINRSKSAPPRPPAGRPPSRLKTDARAKSPVGQGSRQTAESLPHLRHRATSPIPGSRSNLRSNTISPLPTAPPSSYLMPRVPIGAAALKHQKSHSRLQPPVSPATSRRHLSRKASLSSLIDNNLSDPTTPIQATRPPIPSSSSTLHGSRYNTATYASRAKASMTYSHTSSRLYAPDYAVPPTRPSTPSSNPAALRLTLPTTTSRLRSRPNINSIWPTPSPSPSSSTNVSESKSKSPSPSPTPYSRNTVSPTQRHIPSSNRSRGAKLSAPKILKRPKRSRTFGDGTELDGIDDLPTDRDLEGKYRVVPKGFSSGPRLPQEKPGGLQKKNSWEPQKLHPKLRSRTEFPNTLSPPDSVNKRKKASTIPGGPTRRKPTLIRNLSGSGAPKVIGDMKWNPLTLRWEGNDHVLRDFDTATGSSTRPALITHLTGSSIGSPVSSFAGGARIVGHMMFDPVQMCWISRLPPEEEEPDVFAELADDEEEGDGWETKGGTIRAVVPPVGLGAALDSVNASPASSKFREGTPSPARSHSRSLSESGSERGSRMFGPAEQERLAKGLAAAGETDMKLVEACRLAEERHRTEMKGWYIPPRRSSRASLSTQFALDQDRTYLFDIRSVATKKYS